MWVDNTLTPKGLGGVGGLGGTVVLSWQAWLATGSYTEGSTQRSNPARNLPVGITSAGLDK